MENYAQRTQMKYINRNTIQISRYIAFLKWKKEIHDYSKVRLWESQW